ncbi:Antirestriction protein [anaerobic digester metagenome]
MIFQAVLANDRHSEFGVITIPFPIPREDYDHTIQLLEPMKIGDAISRDCRIEEIRTDWPALKQMEMTDANLDELDYLAKRLDSLDNYEMAQFQGMASRLDLHGVDELINLTFCCQRVTVVTDFSNLENLGRRHYLTMNGDCASVEEMQKQAFPNIARNLLDGEVGRVTPYGVVYDNNFEMAQLYDGRHFPEYLYENCVMEVEMCSSRSSAGSPSTHLYLPITQTQQARAMARAEIHSYDDLRLRFVESILPDEVDVSLDFENDSLSDLNEMCRIIKPLSQLDREKLGAVVQFAKPEQASEIVNLVKELERFDYAPKVHTPEEYGKYMIMESGHFEYDDNLSEYIDFTKYGQNRMEQEHGDFTDRGYVAYHGTLDLEELLQGDPVESLSPQMKME